MQKGNDRTTNWRRPFSFRHPCGRALALLAIPVIFLVCWAIAVGNGVLPLLLGPCAVAAALAGSGEAHRRRKDPLARGLALLGCALLSLLSVAGIALLGFDLLLITFGAS